MRYWYDTEFYEDGSTIDLISFGMVAEDGRELYLENAEFDWGRVPQGHWLWDNVWPHLEHDPYKVTNVLATRKVIANRVRNFVTQDGTEFDNELWGYYSSYDHVVLAQLFGRMVDMPDGVPWFTRDIKQEQERIANNWFKHGLLLPEHKGTAHNALADAIWTKQAYEFLVKIEHENWGKEIVDGWA